MYLFVMARFQKNAGSPSVRAASSSQACFPVPVRSVRDLRCCFACFPAAGSGRSFRFSFRGGLCWLSPLLPLSLFLLWLLLFFGLSLLLLLFFFFFLVLSFSGGVASSAATSDISIGSYLYLSA